MKLFAMLVLAVMLIGTASALGFPKNAKCVDMNVVYPCTIPVNITSYPTPSFTYSQPLKMTIENTQAVPQKDNTSAVIVGTGIAVLTAAAALRKKK